MSSPAPAHGNPIPAASPAPPRKREILVISHCTLFYWWPVWAVGFIMGILSLFGGHVMAVVPTGTTSRDNVTVPGLDGNRDVLALPKGKSLKETNSDKLEEPRLHISNSKNLGVFFCAVLLLVIVITNIPLRGLWSVIAIVLIISTVIIFALLEWWETILHYLNFLDIRINAAGYFVISSILFGLWLIVMLVFDRQIYMIFTSGQMRVRQEVGDAETAFDTGGMTVQKQRSDLFRHWVLGLGSGDLIVKTAGANTQEFHFPNVLFIGRKVKEIEDMLRERQVVTGSGS